MKSILSVTFFITICFQLFSENLNQIPFKYLQSEGFDMVRYIYRDKNDYLWVGSGGDGLIKYNSHFLKKYKYNSEDSTSLSNNHVVKIFEDSRDNLWVSTIWGINKFDRETGKSARYLTKNVADKETSIRTVYDILEDSTGRLWIAAGTGLYEYSYEKDTMLLHELKDFPYYSKSITSIAQDTKGNLWLGCIAPCVYRYHPGKNSQELFPINGMRDNSRYDKIVYLDSKGKFWISINDFAFSSFTPSDGEFLHYKVDNDGSGLYSSEVGHLLEYKKDYILIATDQGGINVFNKKTKRFHYISTKHGNAGDLSADGILSITMDKEGIIWVGTSRSGISYFNPKENRFTNIKKSLNFNYPKSNIWLSHGVIGCFYEDSKGLLWIGTDGGGVNVMDRETGNIEVFTAENSNLSTNTIRSIHEDSEGNMIVACWKNSVDKFIRDKGVFVPYDFKTEHKIDKNRSTIWSTLVDKKDRLWITFSEGHVILFDAQGNELYRRVHYDLTNHDEIKIFTLEGEEGIFLLSEEGVFKWNEGKKDFEGPIIKRHDFLSVEKDSKGNYWCATKSRGVFVYDSTYTEIDRYNASDGLSSNKISSLMMADNGDFWIATNKGLNQVNIKDSAVYHYKRTDGLLSNQYFVQSVIKTKSGWLYFGGTQGVDAFDPDKIVRNDYRLNTQLNSIKVYNKDGIFVKNIVGADLDKKIELEWNQNRLEFNYYAINYTFPQKTKYRYRLLGLDKENGYSQTSAKKASYTNISPGKYTFQILAGNSDTLWSKKEESVEIVILKPFWQKVWFYILILVFIFTVIYLVILQRERILVREKIRLEDRVEERTRTIDKQNKVLIYQHKELFSQREQLKMHRDKLEVLVDKRTQELITAKEKAEKSDRLKSFFLANMSHEIRTPMNAIIGFSLLLEDDTITKEDKSDFVNHIVTNSNSLLYLIEDILDFSQIEADQLKITTNPFFINCLLDEVYSSFSLRNENKLLSIELNNELDNESLSLNSDEYRIRQILVNLIGNALKFTEQGSITVGVRLKAKYIQFYVQDTGDGMTPDQLKIIFNQFVKLDRDQYNAKRGIGLGLAISKRLALLLNGDLFVESELNVGSTFYLNIPLS